MATDVPQTRDGEAASRKCGATVVPKPPTAMSGKLAPGTVTVSRGSFEVRLAVIARAASSPSLPRVKTRSKLSPGSGERSLSPLSARGSGTSSPRKRKFATAKAGAAVAMTRTNAVSAIRRMCSS